MPKDIIVEGRSYRVPDNATPDEIDEIVSGRLAAPVTKEQLRANVKAALAKQGLSGPMHGVDTLDTRGFADTRPWQRVAEDAMSEVGHGALNLVPGMVKGIMALPAQNRALREADAAQPSSLMDRARDIGTAAVDVAKTALPIEAGGTVVQGLGALAGIDAAPSQQQWESAQEQVGANAAGLAGGAVASRAVPGVARVIAPAVDDLRGKVAGAMDRRAQTLRYQPAVGSGTWADEAASGYVAEHVANAFGLGPVGRVVAPVAAVVADIIRQRPGYRRGKASLYEGVADRIRPTESPGGPEIRAGVNIEQGIGPTGKGKKFTQMMDAEGTPTTLGEKVMKIAPELATTPPGPVWDTQAYQRFKNMETVLDITEKAVPRSTMVPTAPILQQWRDILRQYTDVSGNVQFSNAAASIQSAIDALEAAGASMAWDDFVKLKRNMRADMTAKPWIRQAYGSLMEASSKISPELSRANANYSAMRTVVDRAGIDVSTKMPNGQIGTGRRVKEVAGKNPFQPAQWEFSEPPAVQSPVVPFRPTMPAPGLASKVVSALERKSVSGAAVEQARQWASSTADSELTGKLVRTGDGGEKIRFGGTNPKRQRGREYSWKDGTPLESFPQAQGVLKEAIYRGKGKLFEEIKRAYEDRLLEDWREQAATPQATDFEFGESRPARIRGRELLREIAR